LYFDQHMISINTMTDTSPQIQNMDSGDNWYVAYTRHLCEKKVSDRLTVNEIVHYLPLYTVVRQWSDRKKKVEKPLISSVVFIKSNNRELNKIYSIPGIIGLLQFNGKPAIVREHEIQNLRILLQEVHADEIEKVIIKAGDLVEVIHGPFQGMQAYAIQMQNNMRLIIEIKSMGIGFSVNVPKSYVKQI
jgi:transcription antitermination factor NusG